MDPFLTVLRLSSDLERVFDRAWWGGGCVWSPGVLVTSWEASYNRHYE